MDTSPGPETEQCSGMEVVPLSFPEPVPEPSLEPVPQSPPESGPVVDEKELLTTAKVPTQPSLSGIKIDAS